MYHIVNLIIRYEKKCKTQKYMSKHIDNLVYRTIKYISLHLMLKYSNKPINNLKNSNYNLKTTRGLIYSRYYLSNIYIRNNRWG